jgi:hypothetical protein
MFEIMSQVESFLWASRNSNSLFTNISIGAMFFSGTVHAMRRTIWHATPEAVLDCSTVKFESEQA